MYLRTANDRRDPSAGSACFSGTELFYSGDFDGKGLSIAQQLRRATRIACICGI
ncbi:MAG: DUF2399 domain-containing protein [Dysosmobacter welbionis]